MEHILNNLFTKTPLVWFLESYWRDEAFSILIAQRSLLDILSLTANDFSPPLYYLTLKTWIFVFGTSEIATRSMSLIFFTLGLYVFCEFIINVLKIKSRIALLVSIILFCTNPLLTYYAFEARGYSMFAFLFMGALYYYEVKKYRLFALFALLAFFTHYFALLIIPFIALDLLMSKRKPTLRNVIDYSPHLACGIAWIGYVALSMVQNKIDTTDFWIPRPTIADLAQFNATLITGYEKTFWFSYDLKFINLTLGIALLIGFYIAVKRKDALYIKYLCATTLCYLMVYVKSLSGGSFFLPRYFIGLTPVLLILFVIGLKNLILYANAQRYGLAFATATLCVLIYQQNLYQKMQVSKRNRPDIKSTINNLRARSNGNDLLFVKTELDFHTAQIYWFHKNNVKIWNKPYSEIPQYVGKVLIDKKDCEFDTAMLKDKVYLLEDTNIVSLLSLKTKQK